MGAIDGKVSGLCPQPPPPVTLPEGNSVHGVDRFVSLTLKNEAGHI